MERAKGSKACPFKLTIVGGGPGGASVLLRAARVGLLEELLQGRDADPENEGGTAGVALLEQGADSVLGCGKLGEYQIKSNTAANKFATNITADKSYTLPPEAASGTVLETLQQSSTAAQLESLGDVPAPLPLAGRFLAEAGQVLARRLRSHPDCAALTSCKVLSATLVMPPPAPAAAAPSRNPANKPNGCRPLDSEQALWCLLLECHDGMAAALPLSRAPVTMRRSNSVSGGGGGSAANAGESGRSSFGSGSSVGCYVLYARRVVLATGGSQIVPEDGVAARHRAKTLSSDDALRPAGQEKLARLLRARPSACFTGDDKATFEEQQGSAEDSNLPQNCSSVNAAAKAGALNLNPRLCIIGGSHSAFSVAWTCMRGLESGIAGSVGPFGAGDVALVHRGPVQVFYASRKEALADGCDEPHAVNRDGQVHAFGGIRGDAKELYHQIRTGAEERVQMHQCKDGGRARFEELCESAAAIVWACGYNTNTVPLFRDESCHNQFQLHRDRGQVAVDSLCRVICEPEPQNTAPTLAAASSPSFSNGAAASRPASKLGSKAGMTAAAPGGPMPVVPNVYALGLGYGVRAVLESGAPDGPSGRADGVAVYQKHAATCVLAHVLGTRVFGDGCATWEQRTEAYEARRRRSRTPSPAKEGRNKSPMKCRSHTLSFVKAGEGSAAGAAPQVASSSLSPVRGTATTPLAPRSVPAARRSTSGSAGFNRSAPAANTPSLLVSTRAPTAAPAPASPPPLRQRPARLPASGGGGGGGGSSGVARKASGAAEATGRQAALWATGSSAVRAVRGSSGTMEAKKRGALPVISGRQGPKGG